MGIKNTISGIYMIININDGKIYIGQTKSLTTRWRQHLYELKKRIHKNLHLQYSYNLDPHSFQYSILEKCEENKRDEREKYWIDYYKSTNDKYGYNIQGGGHNNKTLSEETKRKIGEANKGKTPSPIPLQRLLEYNKEHGVWNKGIPMTDEHKQLLISINTGSKHNPCSEERKQKIGNANRGKTSWNKGGKQTEEWKQKRKDATSIPITDEMVQDVKNLIGVREFKTKYNCEGPWYRIRKEFEIKGRTLISEEMINDINNGISKRKFMEKYNTSGPWRRLRSN